jgi:hypothetical protein
MIKNIRLPSVITFTGVNTMDATENLGKLADIVETWTSVEFGVLSSPTRKQGRYNTTVSTASHLGAKIGSHHVSAHLCGGYANQMMVGIVPPIELRRVARVQVNHSKPDMKAMGNTISSFARPIILQRRSLEPVTDTRFEWLYDCSGGRGITPKQWPKPDPERYTGYAGGINPDNVLKTLYDIGYEMHGGGYGAYWIDMETGILGPDDRVDFDKVRSVLTQVYGEDNEYSGSSRLLHEDGRYPTNEEVDEYFDAMARQDEERHEEPIEDNPF